MSYTPEHGDIYLLKDRAQQGFSVNGTSYSIVPNQWYTANGAIPKGTAVSMVIGGAANTVAITTALNFTTTVGITLTATSGAGPIEVQSYGSYTFTTITPFTSSDFGLIAYIAPVGASIQFTTSRSIALANNDNLIEAGIVTNTNQIFIDFQGDVRSGVFNVSQMNMITGEDINTNGHVLLVAEGLDGKAYLSDKRKSVNNTIPVVGVISGTAGFTYGAVTNPLATTAAFTVTGVGSPGPFTVIINGISLSLTYVSGGVNSVASLIAAAAAWTGSNWTVTSSSATVTLTQTFFGLNRNTILGFLVGSSAAGGLTGVIPAGTNITVQRLGVLTDTNFSFTGNTGQTLWADVSGGWTANATSLSYNADVMTAIGIAKDSVIMYVNIQTASQTNNGYPIGTIMSKPPTGTPDYGWLTTDGSALNAVANPQYQNLFNVIGNTFGGTNNTNFVIPTLSGGPSGFQIKYSYWYVQTIPNTPLFRYDTGWTTWGATPVSVTASANYTSNAATSGTPIGTTPGTGSTAMWLDIPISYFGTTPQITDMFAEIYIKNGSGLVRKVEPSPSIYTNISGPTYYNKYGFQLVASPTSGYIRIEFANNGLGYFDNITNNALIGIDNTWSFRIFLYKTEQYNRFYDYTADQKLSQLFGLGLTDLITPSTTQGNGIIDRGNSLPTAVANRLNINAAFYASNVNTSALIASTINTPFEIVNTASDSNTLNTVITENSGLSSTGLYSFYPNNGIVTRATTAPAGGWWSISYGNGLFVAVAATTSTTAGIATSPDGINWTFRTTTAPAYYWVAITYGNGLFVALAYTNSTTAGIATSPDGISWTFRTTTAPGGNGWWSITYGNGLFVALAYTNSTTAGIATSPDGITWTFRTTTAPGGNGWWSITYGNGLFVALASTTSATGGIATSPDGITWTFRTTTAPGGTGWVAVTYGNGLFVALSQTNSTTGGIATSPDGITWTFRTTTAPASSWWSITYGNGLFVALAYTTSTTGGIATSPDGITWTFRTTTAPAYNWTAITYGNGLFVALAYTTSTTGGIAASQSIVGLL
jgi:hypothetical protein